MALVVAYRRYRCRAQKALAPLPDQIVDGGKRLLLRRGARHIAGTERDLVELGGLLL